MNNTLIKGAKRHSATAPFSMPFGPNSWIELSTTTIEHNITQYKKIIGNNVALAPVIKANAYGHGMREIAQLLDDNQHIERVCVAKLTEALTLRKQGFKKPILVLSILDSAPEEAIINNINVTIWDLKTAEIFNAVAKKLGKNAQLHIKVDTGLSRMGPIYSNAVQLIMSCSKLEHCTIEGVFTHFSNSENTDLSFANLQIERFTNIIEQIKKQNINPPLIHCASSAGQTVLPSSHFTMARLGIGLYGLWPSPDNQKTTNVLHPNFSLQPVMKWKTRINMIKTVPAHSFVGYDLTYKTERETRIAVLPVGYADGYNRLLSNKGTVKIKNQYAAVIGRVAMNLTMVDVTHIKDISLDDEVLLLGKDPHVNAQTIAKLCQTINYEIVTNINQDVHRIIIP